MNDHKQSASTLEDVANAAGVSLGTASKVVAGSANASEARQRHGWEAARKFDYRRWRVSPGGGERARTSGSSRS